MNSTTTPRGAPSRLANRLRQIVEVVAVIAVSIGMLAVAAFLAAVLYSGYMADMWKPIFEKQYVALVGIPGAVIVAIGLVQFFGGIHGPIEFTVGPAKFSGATGPVVLWIFSFLALIFGMKLLWVA